MAISTKTNSTILASLAIFWTAALVGLPGCGQRASESAGAGGEHAAAHDDHAHDHGHEGPHGGHIVELGTEEHHAELTHDDEAHRIGIYLLGSDAKTAAPIDAESVTINVSVDGQPSQYVLSAVAQPGEPAGKASYFELVSEPLCAVVCGESEGAKSHARLSLTISGKPYVGLIKTEAHEHDHNHAEGHSHSHGADDALMWRQELDEQGYHIALGHHGRTLRAGHEVEPAVQITREDRPVADAQVYNALLSSDARTVLANEAATVYEPPTSEEPAHYAQGALKIPADARKVVIRYRIVLPEGSGERTFDVRVAIE
jgi:hypothetical protein